MEEGQISLDNNTHECPSRFFVIATQNPISFAGTYPLPESQLDRFLMRIQIGYPDPKAERVLLNSTDQRQNILAMKQTLTPEDITHISEEIALVHATDTLLDYVTAYCGLYPAGQPVFIWSVTTRCYGVNAQCQDVGANA